MLRLVALLVLVPAGAAQAQGARLAAAVALRAPAASCGLTLHQGLDFGRIQAPAEVPLRLDLVPAAPPASARPGLFTVAGAAARSFTVAVAFPPSLTGAGAPLAYRGAWAESEERVSGYRPVGGTVFRGRAQGRFAHHFRIGGTVTAAVLGTPPGVYAGKVSVTTTCQ